MGERMKIPEIIKELRHRAVMTQAELDKRAGLSAGTIGRIERGDADPRATQFLRIIHATGHEFVIRRKET